MVKYSEALKKLSKLKLNSKKFYEQAGYASILDEIGVLLALKGENPFKVRAYHNAARSIENSEEDLATLIQQEKLDEIPGIGKGIAEKITILVRTGRLPAYEKLKKSIPKGLLDLLNIPGLGTRRVKILYQKLKIKTVVDLANACRKGKIAKLAGFGTKTQDNILHGIAKIKTFGRRILWWNAEKIAHPILAKLSKFRAVKKVEIAGSFRRKLETIGDLDFLVGSASPAAVMKWFTSLPSVEKILSKGSTKASVRLKENIQADLRVVPMDQFAFALMYFTGSKEHNIKMRLRANKMGYRLSEYGLEPLKARAKMPLPKKKLLTETEIFKIFGLSYIPPELREDMGEIAAAEKGKLPALVEEKDIRGIFHCHTTDSDGHNTLEEMVGAAQEFNWEYIGISDHSQSSFQANGMDDPLSFAKRQDPRLIAVGDRLFITYNNMMKGVIDRELRRMLVTEVHFDGENYYAVESTHLTHYEGENIKRSEKNWAPFNHNGNLLLAYSINPHKVLHPLPGTDTCETIASTRGSIQWKWGVLRGGTPALEVDGEYLAFFHSCENMKTAHSKGKNLLHYFMGAYTFAPEPPFYITHVSPEPIIGKDYYHGPIYKPYWKPVKVVFPGGYVFDDQYIWILFGKDDHEIWMTKLDKKILLRSLIPVSNIIRP